MLFAIPFLTAQLVSAQVYEMGSGNSVNPSGISDNGIVSLNNASNNHYIWSTTQGFTLIGSITNDAAFAGTTKISGDGKKVSATVTN
ncbi:MAG: secretion protein, partial [Algoriella sp.]|nr:secretion protein [Algoriella sp.]